MTPGGGEPTRREGDDGPTELTANDAGGRTRLGGRGAGGSAGSPDPAAGSAPGSRRAVLLAVAVVVLVFVVAVGVTLWVTRGTADPPTAGAPSDGGSPTTTTTVTVPGPAASGQGSSVQPTTVTAAGTAVVTVPWTTVVATVDPDRDVVDQFCTPLAEVPGDIDAVIAAWAGGSRSVSAAENANEALAEMYRTITTTVWTGEPSATAVPAMANIWRFSLARLRGVLNAGGTSAFSSAAWDQAVREQRLAAAGFLDECAVAAGAAPMTLDPATAEKACAAVRTQLHSTVDAVRGWSSAPTDAAHAVAARDELELLLEAAESVGAEYRISVGHPVRRQTEGIRIDAEDLLESARAAREPSAAVVSRLASAETALEPLC